MQRIKLDNGKYAYRLQPAQVLAAMRGDFFVIDDEKRTVEFGQVKGEWKKDEDFLSM